MLENLCREMVIEFRRKLGRALTKQELELLLWMKERQFEITYKTRKSS